MSLTEMSQEGKKYLIELSKGNKLVIPAKAGIQGRPSFKLIGYRIESGITAKTKA
jgi:hypothetical protein